MKTVYGLIFAVFLMVAAPVKALAGPGFAGESFLHIMYFEHGGKGSGSGLSEANGAAIATKDVLAIPAKTLITNAYVIVDVAVTGSTAFNLGDDDSAGGFISSDKITHGTPGVYGYAATDKGTYLVSAPGGAYAAPNAKIYTAAGDEVKLAVTGASNAGKFRVVVEGFRFK